MAQAISSQRQEVLNSINDKRRKYEFLCYLNMLVYYAVRLVAGIGSLLIIYAVNTNQALATGLSIAVAISVVVDTVHNPGEKWKIYSDATELLKIAAVKRTGEYEHFKGELEQILSTEQAKLASLVNIEEIIKAGQAQLPPKAP
jgi:hypothetical protein